MITTGLFSVGFLASCGEKAEEAPKASAKEMERQKKEASSEGTSMNGDHATIGAKPR